MRAHWEAGRQLRASGAEGQEEEDRGAGAVWYRPPGPAGYEPINGCESAARAPTPAIQAADADAVFTPRARRAHPTRGTPVKAPAARSSTPAPSRSATSSSRSTASSSARPTCRRRSRACPMAPSSRCACGRRERRPCRSGGPASSWRLRGRRPVLVPIRRDYEQHDRQRGHEVDQGVALGVRQIDGVAVPRGVGERTLATQPRDGAREDLPHQRVADEDDGLRAEQRRHHAHVAAVQCVLASDARVTVNTAPPSSATSGPLERHLLHLRCPWPAHLRISAPSAPMGHLTTCLLR
mgnify:CR=1 FL=1